MKSKILKTTVAIILALSLLICFAACGSSESEEKTEKNNIVEGAESSDSNSSEKSDNGFSLNANAKTGDYITFGKYEQDGDTSNGKEDIEWLVLDVQDGKALVTSKYALDAQPYNIDRVDVTWETCTLRSWLNNDFYSEAFSNTDKSKISVTKVTAENNPEYQTEVGNDTQDKVFLLSINEVYNYFDANNKIICEPTKYAKDKGAYYYDEPDRDYYGNCHWWLRSPGESAENAAKVYGIGLVMKYGDSVDKDSVSVRPAFWLIVD